MKSILSISQKIQEFSAPQGGVFSLADLKSAIDPRNKASFYRILSQLSEAGIIKQFCRGVYVAQDFNLQVLSQRICPDSYISFGTVLARNLLIGSVPSLRLMAVKLGPSRIYEDTTYRIEHLGITKSLFMGYERINGVNIATPEKAFLDTLYYYQKGQKFSFDIYSDIDCDALDRGKVELYLNSYKNKKFVSFANGVCDD